MNHLSLCQRKLNEDIVDCDLLKDLHQEKVFMRPPENIGKMLGLASSLSPERQN
ncbi:hypothetical protein KY285_002780 [Solanum tuberosum]|nr:hypothetical protein KY285_002780 [Solanum tuberosum]